VTRVVQAVHEAIRSAAGVSTLADWHQVAFRPHRHPLIEHETLAQPVLVAESFLISDDAAVELEDIGKALAAEEGRRLFAANPAGAIHQHLAVFEFGELVRVRRQFAEVFDVAGDGILKSSGGGLIAIAHVEHHYIGIVLQKI